MSSKGMGRGSGERYDAEFKQEAVRLLLTSGKTASQLARELRVSSWSLSRWKRDYLKASGEIEVEGQMRSLHRVKAGRIRG
jgi:transposase-like protein